MRSDDIGYLGLWITVVICMIAIPVCVSVIFDESRAYREALCRRAETIAISDQVKARAIALRMREFDFLRGYQQGQEDCAFTSARKDRP